MSPQSNGLRELREKRGLSVDQVVSAVGVTRAVLLSWEAGVSSPYHNRHAYAKVLGITSGEVGSMFYSNAPEVEGDDDEPLG